MNATATPPRQLQLPADLIPALHRALGADRSPAETALLLRRTGYELGPGFHGLLESWLSEARGTDPGSLPPEEFWTAFGAFWSEMGWGTVRHVQPHPGIAALDCEGWIESERGGGDHPACHLTTGLLSDLLSRIGGAEVAVLEVECRSAGAERCRFLFGGSSALGALYEEIRSGATPSDALERIG